jgi:hypothetical protein
MNNSGYADLLNTSYQETDVVYIGTLILPNLDPNSVPYIDNNNTVQDKVLTNGQLLIGNTGNPPSANTITGTTNQVIVTGGSGSITLATPQDIATTSSPTFNNITVNDVEEPNGNLLIGVGFPATNSFCICTANDLNGTNNSIVIGDSSCVNIRPNSSTMDLGTSGAPFQNCTLSGNLDGETYSRDVDNILSCSTSQTTGDLLSWSSAEKVVVDSGVVASQVVINSSLAGVAGNIPEFVNATNLSDSGIAASTLTGGPFLPLAGGTMAGDINMNSHNITNVNDITTSSSTINIGLSNTTSHTGSLSVGASNTAGTSAGGLSVVYGNTNNMSGSTNGQSIIYGSNNSDSNASGGSFIYGFNNTNGTGQRNILIGRDNTIPNGVNEGFVMGFGNTNSTSFSLLVGGTRQANIRAGSTICDLGTTGNPFQNIYSNSSIIGSSTTTNVNNIVSGPASAVSLNLCEFSGTTGKLIADSGIVASTLSGGPFLPLSGGSMTGVIAMTTHNITGTTNTITAGVLDATGSTDSSSQTTGALISAGGIGCGKSLWVGNTIHALSGTNSSSVGTGTVIITGGLSVSQNSWFGGSLNYQANNIIGTGLISTTNISAVDPSLIQIFLSGSNAVSFTANTPTLITISGWTSIVNPFGDFTPTLTTGQIQYTATGGISSPTRWFRVSINMGVLGVAGTNQFQFWISKNSVTTSVTPTLYLFSAAVSTGINPVSYERLVQMAATDTIQLCGVYSATANVTINNINICVSQI